jgi:hypothetical protein
MMTPTTIATAKEALLSYGVEVIDLADFAASICQAPETTQYCVTLRDLSGATASTVMDWTATETDSILQGVQDIGRAFALVRTGISPEQAFRQGMGIDQNGGSAARGNIRFVRVNHLPYCVNVLNAVPRTIVCGSIARGFSNFLAVHELGHVFDNQVAQGGNQSLSDAITIISLLDEAGLWVLGVYAQLPCPNGAISPPGWGRGERGWGSGPGSNYQSLGIHERCQTPIGPNFSQFQQNPFPYQVETGLSAQLVASQETGADMFLNWVYRIQVQGGFENSTWKPNESDEFGYCNRATGCNDNQTTQPLASIRNSGNTRFEWMNSFMQSNLARLIL